MGCWAYRGKRTCLETCLETCLDVFRDVFRYIWTCLDIFELLYYLLCTYSGRVLRIRGGMWWGHVVRRHVITLGLYRRGFQVLGTKGSFNSKQIHRLRTNKLFLLFILIRTCALCPHNNGDLRRERARALSSGDLNSLTSLRFASNKTLFPYTRRSRHSFLD